MAMIDAVWQARARVACRVLIAVAAMPVAACGQPQADAQVQNQAQVPAQLGVATALIRDGDARRALDAYFAAHPQCAPVLDTAGPETLATTPDDAAARALVAAGLIQPLPGGPVVAGGETVVGYRIAPDQRRHFVQGEWGGAAAWLLCFGTRSVRAVTLDVSTSEPRVRYDFSIVDPPAWTKDPAIAAAFPRVVSALSAVFPGEEPVPIVHGRLDLSRLKPTANHPLVLNGAAFVTR